MLPPDFITLSDALRCVPEQAISTQVPASVRLAHKDAIVTPEHTAVEIRSFVEETALLRLRVVESFERMRKRLLRSFAEEVLARELKLQAADTETIAHRLLASFAGELPISISVAPEDAARLHVDLPVCADATLSSGDIVIDFSDGHIESPLHLRAELLVSEISREEEPIQRFLGYVDKESSDDVCSST
jgi:hypothetical protein